MFSFEGTFPQRKPKRKSKPAGLMVVRELWSCRFALVVGRSDSFWQVCGYCETSLELYVGNLQILLGLLGLLWVCWAFFGAVCWQPTGLIEFAGPSLGLYVGNLQVLLGLLGLPWGCMLATYRSYGGFWTAFSCMLATCGSCAAFWTAF